MADPLPADEALMSALAERDLSALATLYDRYGRLAYALAYRILGESEAAEDVVQDAFISAWRGAGSYRRERGNPRGWLLSIVHHRAVDVLRRKTAFRPAPLEVAEQRAADEDTAAMAERNVEQQTVRLALQTLPEAQRRTIELAYFGGYTHVELAELMGVPLGTVKGRMRIGLQKMRRALEGEPGMTDHVTDDLELYAVGALRPREAERVGAHLAECPVCREELAEIATAVNALPDMVLLREPPAGLKERILSAAAADLPVGA